MKHLTESEFEEQFNTRKNHLDNNASFDGCMFETYGAERDYVFELAKKEKRVWTIIESDDGDFYYESGFHIVNRIGFLITEEEYKEETEVKIEF